MARLPHLFTALCALYSLPLASAWTFKWEESDGTIHNEKGSGGEPCTTIDHAKGERFEFDANDDLVRIYLYGSSNCTTTPLDKSETQLSQNAIVPIRGFAIINLAGANTSSGELEPFPQADWFKSSPNSPVITAMGERLVEEGCGKYTSGPGPQWTDVDRKSYQCWQEKLGYSGNDADGWPGKQSWDQLKVPAVEITGTSTSTSTTTTETPSSTSAGTGTPTTTPTPTTTSAPAGGESSGSSLGGGEIAGIVVGCAVGVGIIGAIVYLARRINRQSKPASTEPPEPEGQPEERPDSGAGHGGDSDPFFGAAALGDTKKAPVEKLPTEVESIPARHQKGHYAELPGDMMTAELSDSRRINELSDSQRLVELGDGRR